MLPMLRMTARCITALVGGYCAAAALSSALACGIAHLAPSARTQVTGWAMILSFALYASLALWAFHEMRLMRVCATIWGLALAGFAAIRVMGPLS